MKRLVIAVCMMVATMGSMAAVADEIGVVDMQQLFQNAPEIKKINDQLTQQFSSRRDNIVKMTKDMQNDIVNYQKNQSVMNAKDLDALKDKITQEQNNVRQEQTKFQQDLFQAQNEHMNRFMDRLKDIVKNIAQEKKLDVVVPKNSILYADDKLDITKDILDKLK